MVQYVDLFCGLGSFHKAFDSFSLEHKCVLACDINKHVRDTYANLYDARMEGDICAIEEVPSAGVDVVCAGFPCQPFSQIGFRQGAQDAAGRGTLIDHVLRLVRAMGRPPYVILENVRGLLTSNEGLDFARILQMFEEEGYTMHYSVLKCWDFGIPQLRKRLFMVAVRSDKPFDLPSALEKYKTTSPPLAQYLGIPDLVRQQAFTVRVGGRRSGVDNRHNWDCYMKHDGQVHTLTVEDCAKLQGFTDGIPWPASVCEGERYKMLGNSIPVCMTRAVVGAVLDHMAQ